MLIISIMLCITFIVLSYNWNFIPFDCLHPIPSPPASCSWSTIWSFFLWIWLFVSIIDLQYYVSSFKQHSDSEFQNTQHKSLVTIFHSTKIIHNRWLYFLQYAIHISDSFILLLEVYASKSVSPISFLLLVPCFTLFFLFILDSVSVLLSLFICPGF